MALTSQAKTNYQREYMRRRRATLAHPAGPEEPERPSLDEQVATLEQQPRGDLGSHAPAQPSAPRTGAGPSHLT
jgi:hypothetical protein